MTEGFGEEELEMYRKLGLEAILKKYVTGFNFYPKSIEKEFQDLIHIPLKYAHRKDEFISLLEAALKKEFHDGVDSKRVPRIVIYQWLNGYIFPKPEEKIRIFDIIKGKYIENEHEYANASKRLIAEGQEYSLVIIPENLSLRTLADFVVRKGSFFLLDETGDFIPSKKESKFPFGLNPDRLSDDAYMTPMVITSYRESLLRELPGFRPVKKIYKIKGDQELSTYLDKTYQDFMSFCKINFEPAVLRLANKTFRDFINFEEDPRLSDIF